MWNLFKKELIGVFGGWSAWLLIWIYFLGGTLILWIFPGTSYEDYGYANPQRYFELASYMLLFIAPAITYGVFSSEWRDGTMEILFSLPVRRLDIILAKYLACMMVVCIIVLLSVPVVGVVHQLRLAGEPETGQLAGSLLGIVLVGGLFIAIGLFSSVLSTHAALSFVIAVVLSLFFYDGLYMLGDTEGLTSFPTYQLKRLSVRHQVEFWSQGILTASSVVYLISLQIIFLAAGQLRLNNPKIW